MLKPFPFFAFHAAYLLAACAGSPSKAVLDFAAIHDAEWNHRAEASLSIHPDAWLSESPKNKGERGVYPIHDPAVLDAALLRAMSSVQADHLAQGLEIAAWAGFALLRDSESTTRVSAAALLSVFAARWNAKGIHALEEDATGSLASALGGFSMACEGRDREGREQFLREASRAKIPHLEDGIRALVGIGRKAAAIPLTLAAERSARTLGVRVILLLLESGAADGNPDVARSCLNRLLILKKEILP